MDTNVSDSRLVSIRVNEWFDSSMNLQNSFSDIPTLIY